MIHSAWFNLKVSANLFSFNNPFGACPSCDGLGVKLEFDAELIVPNVSKSIREGALASAMMMVGEIRSKFQNIPGPQGGTVLNGQDILQRGSEMWDKWEERLLSRYGDFLPIMMD